MNDMQMAPASPHDLLGTLIVWSGIAITAFAFLVALKVSIWPGERDPAHPKYIVLRED